MAPSEAPPCSHSNLHLVVWWKWLSQVDPRSQSKLLVGVFLMELRLQLETLLPVKAVRGREGKGLFFQQALHSGAPGLQHGLAGRSCDVRWSPEDLRRQNLEATVIENTVLERGGGGETACYYNSFQMIKGWIQLINV